MPSQLFPKFLGAESKASRNGFDLSKRNVFSTKVGLLNVAWRQHLMPGDEKQIDIRHLIRTQPIQTAAFTRLDCEYNLYKVNYNDLWSGYNQFIAQREDKQLLSTPDNLEIPCFNLGLFLQYTLRLAFLDYVTDNPITLPTGILTGAIFVDVGNDGKQVVLPRYRVTCSPYFDFSAPLEVVRNLDMMGYGNYLPAIIAAYDELKHQVIDEERLDTSKLHETVVDTTSYFNIETIDNLITAIDGTFANYILEWLSPVSKNYYVNLWVPLAYNKIYENHYRNPYYDFEYTINSFTGDFLWPSQYYSYKYVELFNLDDWKSSYKDDASFLARVFAIFCPKYHLYPKDLFTGVLPSTQFGDVSVMTDDRSWLTIEALDVPSSSSSSRVTVEDYQGKYLQTYGNSLGDDSTKFRFDPALAISILNQRRADALQRFNENMMRAGNRTKSIFRAHFGYEPKSEQGHEAYYLGSFDGRIELNTVAATSPAEGVELGQLGSNGVGVVDGKTIYCKSDDFAVILAIFSISKPSEYDSYGVDRLNEILDVWDTPYSELQNISLAPLDSRRLIAYNKLSSSVPDYLGFLPRFIERKTDFDETHGEFFSNNPFSWSRETSLINIRQGVFSNFVTPRIETDFYNDIRFLYISPRSVDNIFSSLANSCQSSDQFLINMQVDCKAVSPLSVIGLPY